MKSLILSVAAVLTFALVGCGGNCKCGSTACKCPGNVPTSAAK